MVLVSDMLDTVRGAMLVLVETARIEEVSQSTDRVATTVAPVSIDVEIKEIVDVDGTKSLVTVLATVVVGPSSV